MTHFVISYAGNKRNEYKYFKDSVNLDGINIKKSIQDKEDFLKLYKSNYDVYEYIVLSKLSSFRFGLYKKK